MIDTVLSDGCVKCNDVQNKALPFSYSKRALLVWEEHCVECSPPYCYHNCDNYLERIDKKCVRMVGGIKRVNGYAGSLPYGAGCQFRKWAKIESRFTNKQIGDSTYLLADKMNRLIGRLALGIAKITKPIWPTLKPYGAFVEMRKKLLNCLTRKEGSTPDVFYVQCILEGKESVQLLIQMESEETILYSQIHKIKRGINEILIPLSGIAGKGIINKTFLSPLDDTDTEIIFSYLDYYYGVRMTEQTIEQKPAAKVKVVAWDLDNTLWNGILVEDDVVSIRNNVIECIKQLDERGILNTIVSKNDFDSAWKKVQSFGLAEYFLAPAINWGQKSENLKSIAKYLNLGIDAFAFIDDNIREREEVLTALPMVRVYDENIIDTLLTLPEFDVPVTEASKTRRLSYIQEVSRKEFEASFTNNYDAFLRSLDMVLSVEKIDESNYDRCFELLARSNQLNLSTNRYSAEEYRQLIKNPNNLCFAFRCKDKFGDYGIVAFLSVKLDGTSATIIDFVISCRVAKKKVEEAILFSLKDQLLANNITSLDARLIKTKKNGPIASVFEELPFKVISCDDTFILFKMDDVSSLSYSGIIKIEYK